MPSSHGLGSYLRWTKRPWKHVLWLDESKFRLVFGKNGRRILCAKGERPSRLLPTKSAKTNYFMGLHQCPCHRCEGSIDVEAYIGIMDRHAAVKTTTFPKNSISGYFSRTIQGLILHELQQTWLCRHRVCVLDWPACSPDSLSY